MGLTVIILWSIWGIAFIAWFIALLTEHMNAAFILCGFLLGISTVNLVRGIWG